MNRKKRVIKERDLKDLKKRFCNIETILQNSLLSQVHNGGELWEADSKKLTATNGQKWWIAVIMGFLFYIIASPLAFRFSNGISTFLYLPKTVSKGNVTFLGLFIHMLIFIFVIRIILW